MALGIAAVVLICLALYFITGHFGFAGANVFLTGAVITTALISFYGFLWYGLGDGDLSVGDMRTAITVAVVSVYLVLIGLVAFLALPIPPSGEGTLLGSFTAAVATVVGFYFGATAYVQVKRPELEDRDRQVWEAIQEAQEAIQEAQEAIQEARRCREELEATRSTGDQ
jgi:hypothetical protein